jgi:hypothetical protein
MNQYTANTNAPDGTLPPSVVADLPPSAHGTAVPRVVDRALIGGTDPRTGITGVNRTTGIGWLTLTLSDDDPAEIIGALAGFLGGYSMNRGRGFGWYRQSTAVGLNGSLVAWDPTSAGSPPLLVSIVQGDFDALGADGSVALLRGLVGLFPVRTVSRFDLWVNVLDAPVRPLEMVAAFDSGQAVTRVKVRHGFDNPGNLQGASFGKRGGPWYFRPYEKLMDDGARWLRLELEARDHLARAALAAVVAGQDLAAVALGYVAGVLDFRERAAGVAHGERAARVAWWSALVEDVEKVRAVAARCPQDLVRRARWLSEGVARSLASVWMVAGDGWLNGVLREGVDRLDNRDRALMAQWGGAG